MPHPSFSPHCDCRVSAGNCATRHDYGTSEGDNTKMNITQSIISGRDRALIGGDYSNYHTQSTRRIHTIRKRLGVTTPKGRKYTPKGPITPQDVAKNAEYVSKLDVSVKVTNNIGGCICFSPVPSEHGLTLCT